MSDLNKILTSCEELGRKAFLSGKKAPCHDQEFMNSYFYKYSPLKNKSVFNKVCDAWNKGWTSEHIKQSDAEFEEYLKKNG